VGGGGGEGGGGDCRRQAAAANECWPGAPGLPCWCCERGRRAAAVLCQVGSSAPAAAAAGGGGPTPRHARQRTQSRAGARSDTPSAVESKGPGCAGDSAHLPPAPPPMPAPGPMPICDAISAMRAMSSELMFWNMPAAMAAISGLIWGPPAPTGRQQRAARCQACLPWQLDRRADAGSGTPQGGGAGSGQGAGWQRKAGLGCGM
jgi:hypothetical protein